MDISRTLSVAGHDYTIFPVNQASVAKLPMCLKVLLENALRHAPDDAASTAIMAGFSKWLDNGHNAIEIEFSPARVMLHDVSGIPLMADLGAMREHMVARGLDPTLVNPVRPVDFIMDHSIITEFAGHRQAMARNVQTEFARNAERYRVAKWAGMSLRNVAVRPPGQGICHQINLEQLAQVVWTEEHPQHGLVAFPDTLVACDSHTPMINALSVLGWGVGAIEGLSAMLGEPIGLRLPEVVGVHLRGRPREGVTTTDIALAMTAYLREVGVVQRFVEFYGPGLDALTLPERATIANMAPEYGATVGFFPTDAETLAFLRLTGRGERAELVEQYCKAQGLWRDDIRPPTFSKVVAFDLDDVVPSLSGPKLPQQRVALADVHRSARAAIGYDGAGSDSLDDGDVVIAAITSCTNTSNPSVMLTAGLLARNAVACGLIAKPWVKTSLSPGSSKVAGYLANADLLRPLEALGFHITGFGCMTCCGGSGALNPEVTEQLAESPRNVAAVLSGNRNFEGRIHPDIDLAYLASPPLVVAYALLGSVCADITRDSLGTDKEGRAVYLRDIWPSSQDLNAVVSAHVNEALYSAPHHVDANTAALWDAIDVEARPTLAWDANSSYILPPPFLNTAKPKATHDDIRDAAILGVFGDHITTDHISPGSRILGGTLAGDFLAEQGIAEGEFSSYLQRRCNHEVMMRGTFNNSRIQNEMTPHKAGGWTVHMPSGQEVSIFAAHQRYAAEGRPLVVIAGREYGTGSSRDWAAKGPHLLGVRVVLAESFERIHRSNLVGMGILPLQFEPGVTRNTLGISGREAVDVTGFGDGMRVNQPLLVRFRNEDGSQFEVAVTSRLETEREIAWYLAGGVMPFVLQKFAA